ncbi:hypothetical protein MJG53_001089 [Ovis ammon polii x Ovis aries]|uniref:Uncharacterized protein n=1 Tax=Ovis ammon polii x Ovis aries TaxID=2918886 RepID=A0ACB9VL06_9CETA|nr:hypothetical protein MJT46_000587 [Ovis ammon polii x Ovis aries]KAI4590040.1 hypothetical protein MJG53_001089 [Ovis ammon polii x Ovis aries]
MSYSQYRYAPPSLERLKSQKCQDNLSFDPNQTQTTAATGNQGNFTKNLTDQQNTASFPFQHELMISHDDHKYIGIWAKAAQCNFGRKTLRRSTYFSLTSQYTFEKPSLKLLALKGLYLDMLLDLGESSRVSACTGMMGKQRGAWDVLFPYMFGFGGAICIMNTNKIQCFLLVSVKMYCK